MKKIHILISSMLCLGLASCFDMNQEPQGEMSSSEAFSTVAEIQSYLNMFYQGSVPVSSNNNSTVTNSAIKTQSSSQSNGIAFGDMNSDNLLPGTFDTRLGVGYIHYQDKITLLNQEVAIKGGSIGFHAMLGVEYKLGKALGLFFNVSTTQGWISKARMVGDGVDETIDLQDQNTIESLSQISIGAGLRFHIGQR